MPPSPQGEGFSPPGFPCWGGACPSRQRRNFADPGMMRQRRSIRRGDSRIARTPDPRRPWYCAKTRFYGFPFEGKLRAAVMRCFFPAGHLPPHPSSGLRETPDATFSSRRRLFSPIPLVGAIHESPALPIPADPGIVRKPRSYGFPFEGKLRAAVMRCCFGRIFATSSVIRLAGDAGCHLPGRNHRLLQVEITDLSPLGLQDVPRKSC